MSVGVTTDQKQTNYLYVKRISFWRCFWRLDDWSAGFLESRDMIINYVLLSIAATWSVLSLKLFVSQ